MPTSSAPLQTAINFLTQTSATCIALQTKSISASPSRNIFRFQSLHSTFYFSNPGDHDAYLNSNHRGSTLFRVRHHSCQCAELHPSSSAPKLEHFDLSRIDKSLDPCQDFYQYACSKWNTANPIPADQVAWGTGSGLQYWNEIYFARSYGRKLPRKPAIAPTMSRKSVTTGLPAWTNQESSLPEPAI